MRLLRAAVVALALLAAAPVQAQALSAEKGQALKTYQRESLRVVPSGSGSGFYVYDGYNANVRIGPFAYALEDWATHEAYTRRYRQMKTVAILMWSGGGVLAYTGFQGGLVVASASSDWETQRLALVGGLGVSVVGLGLVGLGFPYFFLNKKKLQRVSYWYTPAVAEQAVADHNARLREQLGLTEEDVKPPQGSQLWRPRIEVVPVIGPGGVALVGRF